MVITLDSHPEEYIKVFVRRCPSCGFISHVHSVYNGGFQCQDCESLFGYTEGHINFIEPWLIDHLKSIKP